MISFDTNVVVRLLVDDDAVQCERASRAFRQAVADGGVFVSATVLVEVVWVLPSRVQKDRATIVAALRRLVASEGVTVEHDAWVGRAIAAYEAGPADFSDYFILESSREANALPVLTFDERFARSANVQEVPSA